MADFKAVKDSGFRQEFDTGAVRDIQTGKGRFDLIPPQIMFRLAKHYENGAVKYGENNWTKGIPSRRYIDSALRHVFNYIMGNREEDHLSAAIWNLSCVMWNEETNTMHDMFDWNPHE